MKKKDVEKLENGIYLINWKSGGHSVAAVGTTCDGKKWLAPTNWVFPTDRRSPWKMVKHVFLICTQKTFDLPIGVDTPPPE